ncbi:MAG: hypothetical protein FWE82_08020 [Defluviitaleaceae bacterium]|nr:hypothetical protein [Defluviitaleaceae bacterium]
MSFKPTHIIIIIAVAIGAAAAAWFSSQKILTLSGPPPIAVISGGNTIEWEVLPVEWRGKTHPKEDVFKKIMSGADIESLPYIKDGNSVTVSFKRKPPQSVWLYEYVLGKNGAELYRVEPEEYFVNLDGGLSFSFELKPNLTTALSSNHASYLPGGVIKGYRLVYSLGSDVCEYYFIVRGDAAWLADQLE